MDIRIVSPVEVAFSPPARKTLTVETLVEMGTCLGTWRNCFDGLLFYQVVIDNLIDYFSTLLDNRDV